MPSWIHLNTSVASEISLLIPDFRKKLIEALETTRGRGFRMEPVSTLVSPVEQAALWKQGRSATDAELKAMSLENAKARFLAECLRRGIVRETNLVTDDLPGFSWHQWGEAASVVWVDGQNKLNLSPDFKEYQKDGQKLNGYQVFVEECLKVELFAGASFNTVQFRSGTPSTHYSVQDIDKEMKKRFAR